MKKRASLLLGILLLVVGFASIATNLILNGTLNIGFNSTDFDHDVVFVKTETDGVASISEDGKSITYTAKSLTTVNEETSLTFWIKNKSTQYDADAVIECSHDTGSTL